MSTAAPRPDGDSTIRSFHAWRAERPFWGALVALAGAIELYSVTMAPLSVVVMQGLAGLSTLFISALTVILAVLSLAQPHLRQVTGWVIIVLGILSILVSNLGGFVVGMLLMVSGGALILAWAPADVTLPDDGVVEGDAAEPAATALLPAATAAATAPDAGPRPAPGRRPPPAGKRPPGTGKRPPPERGGGSRLLDAMLGRQPARRPVKRTTPPGRRPPTGKRPPSDARGGSGEGSRARRTPDGDAGGPGAGGGLLPPPRPTDVRSRTWILVPLLAASLAATTVAAAPAGAAGVPRGDSIWDILFPPPPTTPPPAPQPSAPAPSPGATAPGLSDLLPGLLPPPAPSVPATPAVPPPADCSRDAYPESLPRMGSAGALEAAAAVRACSAAAAEAPPRTASAADGTPVVSAEISTLRATSLTMNGLSYDGVTTLRRSAGGPVQVLVFSLDTLDVAGMDQTYPFDGSRAVSIRNATGDAHITGNVKLYVTKMTGSVFGLVELTFTPESPPPLIVPFLIMTNTTSEVALVQADQVRAASLVSTVS